MEFRYLLCTLAWCCTVLALGIPKYDAQRPLLPTSSQIQTLDNVAGIILEFTQKGSDKRHRYEIPLRAPTISGMRLGIDLPSHPDTMKIVAAINEEGHSASLEALKGVICRVVPRITVEEKAVIKQRVWPWFTVADGAVRFETPASRWYLAGRPIESYECR